MILQLNKKGTVRNYGSLSLYPKINKGDKPMDELKEKLYKLSAIIADNNQKESEAIQGYVEQLKAITEAMGAAEQAEEGAEIKAFLEKLHAATEEKISDELNHTESLTQEFIEMTGIKAAED